MKVPANTTKINAIKNKTIGTIDKIPNKAPNVDSLFFSDFLYKNLLKIKHKKLTQEQKI